MYSESLLLLWAPPLSFTRAFSFTQVIVISLFASEPADIRHNAVTDLMPPVYSTTKEDGKGSATTQNHSVDAAVEEQNSEKEGSPQETVPAIRGSEQEDEKEQMAVGDGGGEPHGRAKEHKRKEERTKKKMEKQETKRREEERGAQFVQVANGVMLKGVCVYVCVHVYVCVCVCVCVLFVWLSNW